MSFRHLPSNYPFSPSKAHPSPLDDPAPTAAPPAASSPTMRKRQRTTLDMANPAVADPQQPPQQPNQHQSHLPQQQQQQPPLPQSGVPEDGFINDQDAAESGGDDDDEEEKPKDKKAGRRKIKIEFIQDKSRRHITFSKRKAGIMKKAYELSTLTGTQVLLLVVSETGLVYTFTTAKLQPLVTQPEGKNLIQACLNATPGNMPPSMPVGAPMPRSNLAGPMSMPGASTTANLPGGLSIPGPPVGQGPTKEDGDEDADDEVAHSGRTATAGDKRRRRPSTTGAGSASRGGPGSPQTPNSNIPPPLSIPTASQHQPAQAPPPPQIALGSPTSPQQQHSQVPSSPQYGPSAASGYASHGQHHGHHAGSPTDAGMYSGHMIPPPGYAYPGGPGGPGGQGGQPLGGLAAAAGPHNHWAPPPVGQGGHYGRR
ncbi:SRF-type transcription factor (DNA-binding and dimerization domain)-domain-containing protein [Scleroderma yunnanense]